VSQKRANFKTVSLKIIRIDFDDIWQKYSKYSRIECRLQFSCRFAFWNHFSSFKPDTDNNSIFEYYATHCLSTWRAVRWRPKSLITEKIYRNHRTKITNAVWQNHQIRGNKNHERLQVWTRH